MSAIIYKTIAEVKLLHEYYLTDSTGQNIFEKNPQSERLKYLEKKFTSDAPSINDDLSFEIPASIKDSLEGHHIRLLKTYSGFRLVTAVAETILEDGSKKYRPFFPTPAEFSIPVLARKKSLNINTLTNLRLKRNVPAILYFTNDTRAGARNFPYLTHDLSSYSLLTAYEQGELAIHGGNEIREFYPDGGIGQWQTVKGNAFANENDRLLVPTRFNYSFMPADAVLDLEFTLLDKYGNTVASVRQQATEPIIRAGLDFSAVIPSGHGAQPELYTLESRINNSSTRTNKLLFTDDPDLLNSWAVIDLRMMTNEAEYNLLDNEGFLKTRKSATGNIENTPVLEIHLKSRLTYWRYMHEKKLKLLLSPKTQDLLDNLDGVLISKTPRASVRSGLLFPVPGSPAPRFLPCPVPADLIIERDRFFSNILVTKSDIFPVAQNP